MKVLSLPVLGSILLAGVTACSPFSPDLGVAPYKCAAADPGPRCPTGYTCMEGDPADPTTHVCVADGETAPDGGGGGFQCLPDTFGDNDTIMGAFQTPVAGQSQMFAALTSLCPELDRDNYAISISTPSTVKVTTSWESGSPVNVSLLNSGGTSIGNGIAVDGMNAMCVCQNSLPAATYYASVFAASTVKNNYRVEIKIATTADCTAPPKCN